MSHLELIELHSPHPSPRINRSTVQHRKVLNSDMDISAEDAEVQAVCNAVWTDAIKAAWKTQKESDPLG